jgi:hypothetical protein
MLAKSCVLLTLISLEAFVTAACPRDSSHVDSGENNGETGQDHGARG